MSFRAHRAAPTAGHVSGGRKIMMLLAHIRVAVALLTILMALTVSAPTFAQQPNPDGTPNPDASAVNEQTLLKEYPRIEGWISIPNETASVLMQPAGRSWDFYHEVLLHWAALAVILGTLLILAIFYVAVGPLRISAGRSGTRMLRFTTFERFSHWLTATSFVVLALTGLNITFGKRVLLPLIGPDAFSLVAQYAKFVHDYVSFAFVLGLVLIVSMWMKDNIPRKIDLIWLKEGGGFIAGKHPTAGRFNAGEKLVFWLALGGGVAVAVSGYLLMFPFYVTNIAGMQVAQVVHSVVAVLFVALILGHIYIGTLGTKGAFEAMGTGSVDLNWAKEHHRVWLEEEIAKGHVKQPFPSATPAE
jgi:formate dehydrogenase subunit gamma